MLSLQHGTHKGLCIVLWRHFLCYLAFYMIRMEENLIKVSLFYILKYKIYNHIKRLFVENK